MKRWHRVLALALALALVNAVTQIVIRANFSTGRYPAQADIGIPIMTTGYLSLMLAGWLLLLALFTRLGAVRTYFSHGGPRSDLVIAGIGALYLAPVVFALGGIVYWTTPDHYAIVAAYAALLLVVIALGWDDFQTLRAIERAPHARPAAAAPAPLAHPGIWYAISLALFLYALPYIHNFGCLELPFNSGYDLALLYFGLPALALAVPGGRWIGARLGWSSRRAGALVAGAGLFFWIVVLGQGYVVLANALLSPQRPLDYQGIVVEKLTAGLRGTNHIVRVELASGTHEVISMEVSEYDFSRLRVGDRMAQPMMLGALQIPYVGHCRWLPSRRGGT